MSRQKASEMPVSRPSLECARDEGGGGGGYSGGHRQQTKTSVQGETCVLKARWPAMAVGFAVV